MVGPLERMFDVLQLGCAFFSKEILHLEMKTILHLCQVHYKSFLQFHMAKKII
jgi:hypothetical protein